MSDKENLILGALLHDIGKFYQRADAPLSDEFSYKRVKLKGHGHARWSAQFIKNHSALFSNPDVLTDLVLYHGNPGKKPDNLMVRLISIADGLSSSERREEEEYFEREGKEMGELPEIPLISVFEDINLGRSDTRKPVHKAYYLRPLELNKQVLFPFLKYPDEKLHLNAYKEACEELEKDLKKLKSENFTTLYYLLNKHIWAVPSATLRVEIYPDVSLFDHSKTTAAIALCLFKNYKLHTNDYALKLDQFLSKAYKIKTGKWKGPPLSETEKGMLKEPLFCLLSADMFGIQKFIYTPSNIPGTSKRLRGRSFHLAMMTEVIARYILFHPNIDLSIANLLYCGGGRFDILLPNVDHVISKVDEIIEEINDWLYEEFHGEIGFVFEKIEFGCRQFEEWDELLKKMDDKIAKAKKNKRSKQIEKQGSTFFILEKEYHQIRLDICKSCGSTAIPYGEEICHYCEEHRQIGEKLPKTDAIILCQGDGEVQVNSDGFDKWEIGFGKFGKAILIIKLQELKDVQPKLQIKGKLSNIEYLKLNDTADFLDAADLGDAPASFGFKFIGNVVPLENGNVMEFSSIADASDGAKKLGILKMDVDHLGLILEIGFSHKMPSNRTISRIATISRAIDVFFAGYVHKICENHKNPYIIYSGGDDLLIVGPWSEIPHLAKHIHNDFREYTCENPDITLSAGMFICDPKFPVKRFAPLVTDELDKSKMKGRNRSAVFGEIASWSSENGEIPFREFIEFGDELCDYLNQRKIARGFLHELLQIHSRYFTEDGKVEKLYIPYLIYQITRNIKDKEVRNRLYERLITSRQGIKWMEKIKIPVSYALLKSRR